MSVMIAFNIYIYLTLTCLRCIVFLKDTLNTITNNEIKMHYFCAKRFTNL